VIRFFQIEAAGSLLLLAATAVALVWANSLWSEGYRTLWPRSWTSMPARFTWRRTCATG